MWAPSRDISKIRSWTIEKLAGCSLGIWPQVWKCPEGDPLGVSHHGLSALRLEDDTWENHSEILWTLPAGRHSIAEVQTRVQVLLPEFRSSNVPFAFLVRYVSYGPFFVGSYGWQWGFSLQPFGERLHQFLLGRLVNESKCLLPAINFGYFGTQPHSMISKEIWRQGSAKAFLGCSSPTKYIICMLQVGFKHVPYGPQKYGHVQPTNVDLHR